MGDMFTFSASGHRGMLLFVLTCSLLFPKNNLQLTFLYRKYEQLAEKKLSPSLQQLDRLSSGWVAIFEVWSISDPVQHTLKHSIRIPLITKEIQIQIYQSFWCEATS